MRVLGAVKAALIVLVTLTPASGSLIQGTSSQGIRSRVLHDSAVRKVLMLADQMRKGGSDVGTEHLLLTDGEEATGTPPLHPGLGPSLLVGPHKGPHTPTHEGPHVPCLLFAACIESLGSRRKVITAVMAGLGAEAAWRRAVAAAETAIEAVPATSICHQGRSSKFRQGEPSSLVTGYPPRKRQHSVQTRSRVWKQGVSRSLSQTSIAEPS